MSLKTGFAQIFSCCPKNLSCPNFGGAAAPLAPPARTPMVFRAIRELLPCQSYCIESSALTTCYSCQKKEKFFFFLLFVLNSDSQFRPCDA